ncbi:DNA polymerase Y family protein [Actinoplanes sp. NPDC049596]|uniref:DNA polymerase Y family protein n=1 Tax=unclassified Actinoplanes TaxID=2626549 RepID=UPI003429C580
MAVAGVTGAAGARTMLLWCPDWAVVAAEIVEGVPASEAVVVLRGNRVIACSEGARREGVRKGLRRREAQSRCPQLVVVEDDPGRDARAFEPVVAAVEEAAVGVEVIRPGALAFAARGPSRYFGGEEAAAERIVEQVAQQCEVESQIGVAEGVFAAGLAARRGLLIPAGRTAAFLAGEPVEALERPELVDLLKRLGIKTLGDFARLPAGDVLSRFGFDGALAHRLAGGFDHRPLAVRKPPPDLEVEETYDEPLERVDVAAFAGRALAERLHDNLAAYGLACTRLGIEAVTANGQELHRVWRHDGTLTAAAIAERVRWQLDGWLTGARRGAPARPTAGLVRLRLIPDGVLVHLGLQPGLWGDAGAERERAHRAFSRVQGLLGPHAVVTPVLGGGRSTDDQIRLVPWGDERDPARPSAPHSDPVPGVTTAPLRPLSDTPSLTPDLPDYHPPTPAVRPEQHPDGAVIPMSSRRPKNTEPIPSWEDLQGMGQALASVSRLSDHRPTSGREPALGGESALGWGSALGWESALGWGSALGGESASNPETASGREAVLDREPASGPESMGGLKSVPGLEPVAGPELALGPKSAGGSEPSDEITVLGLRPWAKRVGRKPPKPPALPPWPGRLPKPAPAMVLPQPVGAVVLDAAGTPVGVSARLELTGEPAALVIERGRPVGITGWAGPWPIDERWWAAGEGRRRARFQVVLADERAFLLILATGHWAVEAIYD